MKRQREARDAIQGFFSGKRDKLASGPGQQAKHRFLAEMNGVARDLEEKAAWLADRGKDWQPVKKEAKRELAELKDRWVERLGGDDPVASAPNRGLIEKIKGL